LPIGTRLNLQFSLHEDPDKAMFCTAEAEVVRTTTGKGKYPEGFAVRFLKINKAQQKHLTNFLEDVPAIV
jgi:c-di-GMP-binding flagellar brake protein YcgR